MKDLKSGSIAHQKPLNELLQCIKIESEDTTMIHTVSDRGDEVGENGLFVALKGEHQDGHIFCDEVVGRGGYVLREQEAGKHVILYPCPRAAYSVLLQKLMDYPCRKLKMIAVTGTNGKSTTASFVVQLLRNRGKRCCLIGTGKIDFDHEIMESANTTPGPGVLSRLMDRAVKEGLDAVVMEVSSQAAAMHRVAGMEFDVVILTQIRSDHLDYHKTHKAYVESKFSVFRQLKPEGTAVLNCTDPVYPQWKEKLENVVSYGDEPIRRHQDALIITKKDESVCVPFPAEFNGMNALAALACVKVLEKDVRLKELENLKLPAGRMQVVCSEPFLCIVDYAHTSSALKACLSYYRTVADHRHKDLWVVFGCGGNRDQGKRPEMGKIACELADHVILCNDNPRNEEPWDILDQIAEGCDGKQKIICERPQAIQFVVSSAETNDIIVVAGKGEESSVIRETTQTCLNDHDLIMAMLRKVRRI